MTLDPTTRRTMEREFGRDLSQVRLHVGEPAARSAAALHAAAYTVGRDVVFGAGRFAPDRLEGRQLLAHELAHVLQQRPGPAARGAKAGQGEELAARDAATRVAAGLPAPALGGGRPPALARQPEGEPVHIPIGTGRLTLLPGPGPLSLLGERFPLPGSLRATNALGLGAGPTFVADLDPRQLVLNLLGTVDLQTSTLAGAPEGREADPAHQARIQLVRPTARLDFSSGRIDGWATLHVPSSYPPAFHPGTDVDVRIESRLADPLRWQVGASYGPLRADATVRLRYDTGRLAGALASSGPGALGAELTAPGVDVQGTARLFGVTTTSFGLQAPTTRPRERPLLGAPTPFPSRLSARGVIVVPPGSVTSVAAPALGATASSFGERRGISGTVAALPTISPTAISAGGPVTSMFPILAYAEVAYVQRVSDGLELGVRLVLQVNTAELLNPTGGLPAPEPPGRPQAPSLRPEPPTLPQPTSPFGGVTIFGRFNAL
jgi:hypothetical protein